MKVLCKDVDDEGLHAMLGRKVVLFCVNYIYSGKLVGVNEHDVKLEDAKIVYETGELCGGMNKDAQPLPHDWYIRTAAVESYGEI